jgi:hypothetical protein
MSSLRSLVALTDLERTSKTQVFQKAVMNYMAENMDRLEQRDNQMKRLGL